MSGRPTVRSRRTILTKRGMPYKARASWVRNCHSSPRWRRSSTWRRAVGLTEVYWEACEMHMCYNSQTSNRGNAEVDLESHVHGKRACVVWGRADGKGLSFSTSPAAYSTALPPVCGSSLFCSSRNERYESMCSVEL